MSSVVPEGWSKNTINECCEILDSQRVPVNSEERAKRKGDYPYYGANGVQGFIDDYIFEGDAILLAEDGGNFDQYADRPIAQWVTGKFWVNNHAHILRAKDNATDKWIFYSLVHKNILKNINGGTRAKLNQSDLKEIEILLSPLPEQKKIASILTSVDEVIENTQKQIDKLQDLKKATMNELLTKGIGHTKFKNSELGPIPRGWEVIKLSDLCSLHYGKSPKGIEDDDGMYPIYGTGGIVGRTNSALHSGKSIVIGRKGSIDNVSFVDSPLWAIDTTYYVEGKNVEMKWLFYRLQFEGLQKYNEASGVPSLSRDTLYNIAIQSPPASEQTQICVILDAVASHISSLNNKLNQIQSFKKSLMQDLLTGKVRVTVN